MPETNLHELRRWQRDLGKQAAEREKITRAIAGRGEELRAVEIQLGNLAALGDAAAIEAARAKRERLAATRREELGRLVQFDDGIRDAIGRGGLRIDPGDADPSVPLLLLPVRIETRFTPDGSALRVRIFPDDVHIDALDRGVDDAERDAGIAYWNTVWNSGDADGTAWRTLLGQAGKLRAHWVALALRPTNFDQRDVDPAPAFPDTTPRTRHAAVARLLPDAFTAVAIQGAERRSQTGRAVLPQVTVGLYANDGSELEDVNGVKTVPGAKWLADYAEAERIGMAVTVPLAHPRQKVDRLFVFGVRRSLDPKSAASELASLLEAHRCTQGLAFVPQGTPTNNTETDRAGWQRRIEPRPPVSAAPDANSNAAVLAAALGISAGALADVDHADEREQSRAAAMNVALWGPSWGGFLDKVNKVTKDGATLSDSTREATRTFHRDFVRGRGPLPALRIGSQPYGILPVSSVERRWQTTRGDTFETGLLPLLQRLRLRWRQCVPKVPRVGVGPIDETLQELLGSSAVCLALRVRPVLSTGIAQLAPDVTDASQADLEVERLISELMFEEVIANASLVHPTGSLGASRPLALPFVHESDPAFIDALLAGSSPGAESVFQVLINLAWAYTKLAVDKDGADGRLAEIVRNATTLSAGDREKTLAVASRAETTNAAALFAEAKRIGSLIPAGTPTHLEYQPVATVSRSFGELAVQSTSATARADLSLFATHAWLNSRARLNELRDALTELKGTGLDERRILFAETLDLASHRLDAWLTALVERRRRTLRAARPDGLCIGAYGWVEEIVPTGNRQLDGGFIHAPSLTHAATAGILRSAFLSHNADGGGNGAFAVDLSSARVRTALHLADGVRQGQPLAGLLGYKIERHIHEQELDRFILSLRTIAPLSPGKLTDRGETATPEALEALAAANVVDGIELVEKIQGKVKLWDALRVRAELDKRPVNNPYLTGAWPPLTNAEWGKIAGIIEEAAAALDAAGDLLLAESVHQLVAGSTARAAAALDAASSGDSPPPDPEVIATPAEGMPFTHRLMLVAGGAEPWNLTRPRSAAEPRLEAWAAARLGLPGTIIVAAAADGTLRSLADTEFCVLDFIYDSTDREALADRLTTVFGVAVDLSNDRAANWPAGMRDLGDALELATSLRALLVGARPATPADFAVPNAEATRVPGELAAARDRAQAARDLLDLRCTMLKSLLDARVEDAAQLRAALEALAAFGVVTPLVPDNQLSFVAQATLAAALRRLQNADAAFARPLNAEAVSQAGQALFGEGFWILPTIGAPAAADAWSGSLAAPPAGATATRIRTLLTDLASVRDGSRRLAEAIMLCEATGLAPVLRVSQLAGAGGAPPGRWIGGPLALDEPTPTVPMLSTVLDAPADYDGSGPAAALVLDEWIDVVPIRQRRGKTDDAPIDERHTTGLTFNAMAPSARAPQAMLLAVSPDGVRWTGDAIIKTLEETLDLALLRAVTLERTNGIANLIPALYEQSWSLQGEPVLNLKLKDTISAVTSLYIREKLP